MSGKKGKKNICALLACVLILTGCQGTQGEDGSDASATEEGLKVSAFSAEETSGVSAEISDSTQASVQSASEMFTDRDYRTEYEENAAEITLEGNTAVCGSDAVQINGSTVTITEEGTYILSGTLQDGSIVVAAGKKDKVQLVLNQVSVISADSAALYVGQADKVFVTLAEGTENTLGNGGTFADSEESNIDAAVFSREDLTLNGTGSLTVESPAGHGIVSKDDLVFTGGTYALSCAGQGLCGKDSVRIADGVFTITAGKDGIHSENDEDDTKGFVYLLSGTFSITAEGDGVSASGTIQIEDGNFTITAGGGSVSQSKDRPSSRGRFGGSGDGESDWTGDDGTSMKGIKASGNLIVNEGNFAIDAADDGVHSNSMITVSGGEFTITSGDDGIHADDSLTVSDGEITVVESYEGLEGLHMVISGGEITITATDDGLNTAGGTDSSGFGGRDGRFGGGWDTSSSDGTLLISGGSIRIHASGDAIDVNGSMEMTGGTIITSGPNTGDTSILDYDLTAVISGGTFIGTGSSMMAENFSEASTQGAILAVVSAQSAGTVVTLSDSEGNVLTEQETDQDFSCVLISLGEILKGETYTLTVGNEAQSITMDSLIVSTGSGRGRW